MSGKRGLFCGLATLDIVYRVAELPALDEKIVAMSQEVIGGGPALNAAVTFAALGGKATLLTSLGRHVLAAAVKADLEACDVTLIDMTPDRQEAPAVATVLVKDSTGERSVVSIGAINSDCPAPEKSLLEELIQDTDIVLFDGHHPKLALAVAQSAQGHKKPTVLDAGSWKAVLDELLPLMRHVVASARFDTPTTAAYYELAAQLGEKAVAIHLDLRKRTKSQNIAISNGSGDISLSLHGDLLSFPVDKIEAVDTLGAGDVLHGAFALCIAHLETSEDWAFLTALYRASKIATFKCAHKGRLWLKETGVKYWGSNLLKEPAEEDVVKGKGLKLIAPAHRLE